MGHFYGGKFMTLISKLADTVILSTLWAISCIPIFTIGTSTTALYYTVHKTLVRNRGYIWQTYWKAWRDNFKRATLAWLIQLAFVLLFTVDITIMRSVAEQATGFQVLLYIFYVLMAMMAVWFYYAVAYQARFENSLKNCLKNSGVIAFLNFPWSLLILVIFGLCAFAVMVIPILIFLLPAVQILLYDVILERIFRKYMKPEELELELQNDRMDIE
jgi:uncharacterized membrane protein YesL